ncbi:P-loop containing nucleoside triphosphate hydrolase protein [Halenospora varia]|nr:P-loop containing nucleoside triphosphate hydrolase protein [Halenospora varia]
MLRSTASKQSTPWPTVLLPFKLPRARLLTWGYDAYVVQASVASKNRLTDHALNLLIDLTNDRASCNASGRPFIFVAHSLGGLVCKEAILSSRNNPEPHLRDVFEHTTGIIFMGTPHRGSWMADWMKIPASGLGVLKSTNKSLLQVLETDDQLLESIQVRFWSMVREQRESVGQVVSKVSATLEGYTSVSVHANHRDMVKFRTENDNGFKRLIGDLMRWQGETRSTTNAIYQPYYYLPFRKNRQFVGRTTILETLEKKLSIEQSETVALVGLGGIGKTQVALQFAYSVKTNKQEYSIFWVAALSEASFEKAYAELAHELGVKKSKENEDVKELVRRHLRSEKAGKWLLIVDNADDMEVVMGSNEKRGIYRYLPESESGRVVFTTRSREVAVAVARSHIIDLREMSQEEAAAFLETSLTRNHFYALVIGVDRKSDDRKT